MLRQFRLGHESIERSGKTRPLRGQGERPTRFEKSDRMRAEPRLIDLRIYRSNSVGAFDRIEMQDGLIIAVETSERAGCCELRADETQLRKVVECHIRIWALWLWGPRRLVDPGNPAMNIEPFRDFLGRDRRVGPCPNVKHLPQPSSPPGRVLRDL
jgi:hypothetical protein